MVIASGCREAYFAHNYLQTDKNRIMKQIIFTKDERVILQGFLEKRLDYYHKYLNEIGLIDRTGKRNFDSFYIKPLISALEKISNQESASFDSKEKLVFISCINEHFDDVYNELKLPTALSWLTISDKQRQIITQIDTYKDILQKSGYYSKKHSFVRYDTKFRYRNILEVVEKMRLSDIIFLSHVGQGYFYKIAFVCNNEEYFPFELSQQISLRDIKFIPFNGQTLESIAAKKFSLTTTKSNTRELISTCEPIHYPEGVLDFIKELLS